MSYLKKMKRKVKQIESLREATSKLTDRELCAKTEEFREYLTKGTTTLNELLPEAFAVVREASKRTIGIEHYPVQLMAGIALHDGKLAEQKTGEGKSLSCTCPAYLNALEGKGVHIVTVNDYLAKRDAEEMGKVFSFLGLSTGVIISSTSKEERKHAYHCDITYVTNTELGFDYLRDNMVLDIEKRVHRKMHYAIIDEVDSVLIDEARTPLIISGSGRKASSIYIACDILAQEMERGEGDGELSKIDAFSGVPLNQDGDFLVNEKDKNISITMRGIKKAETFFHLDDLSDPRNLVIYHILVQALYAHNLMCKDRDYVVKDGQVQIVDEFTGRVLPGRRYSDGLHQALEAKEKVKINPENQTQATITYQHLFNKYTKKAGMTGTAHTDRKEFKKLYHLETVVLPTNKPICRIDQEDIVYKTKEEKYQAILDLVKSVNSKGQPVLVGTASIGVSEELSSLFTGANIPHWTLNAKQDEQEALIIAEAGKFGAVTIATNMAGRGTDIKLDEKSREAGGLYVIGTERHESRRVDDQLRGRSGRQGDPGKSVFCISLEDGLMRLFGSNKLKKMHSFLGYKDGEPITDRFISKAVKRAQKNVEAIHFEMRKNLSDYDGVMNEQRELIYQERNRILETDDFDAIVESIIQKTIIALRKSCKNKKDLDCAVDRIVHIPSFIKEKSSSYETYLKRKYKSQKEKFHNVEEMQQYIRKTLLILIDQMWMLHLDNLDSLREGIGLNIYAQKDPLLEYQIRSYQLFDQMLEKIRYHFLIMYFSYQQETSE